jgi:hypothetical protein
MSGGVDSSVSAMLLAKEVSGIHCYAYEKCLTFLQDYDLSAVYMRNWDTRDEYASDKGCEWEKDWQDVQVVCRKLGIPCELVRCHYRMLLCISERFQHRSISPESIGTVSLSRHCGSGNLASAQTLTFGVTSKGFTTSHFSLGN